MLMIVGMGWRLYAQDCAPTPIVVGPGSPVTQQMIDMVMDTVRPPIFIGWNWGASLHQVNADLHSNVWHLRSPFSASTRGTNPAVREPYHEMSKTTDSMKLILVAARPYDRSDMLAVCPWYVPLYDRAQATGEAGGRGGINMTFSGDDPIALTEGLGIRYQPEYVVNTTSFTPMVGDTQGAGFGFQNKVHGTISGQRFVLQQAGLVGTPTVLSGCWPNTHLVEWSELANTRQTSPFNGRRMYAAINLRRHDASDVADNDDVVLRLRVQYKLCDNTTGYIRFDSLPNPNGATGGRIALPLRLDGSGRGQASLLVNNTSGVPDTQMVITRRMIPRGSDATRDITIMAHFILDVNPYENADGTITDIDGVNFNPRFLLEKKYLDGGCNPSTGASIRELNVEVIYEGRSDVSIDWVQLASDNGTRFLQGYYDETGRQACADILEDFRLYDSITNKGLRIYRWFNRDEGREGYWEGMRYFHQLFWKKSLTERGAHHQIARYNYMVGADVSWLGDGYIPILNTRTAVPYYKNGYINDAVGMNGANQPAMWERRYEYLMNEWGAQSTELGTPINYDLRWGVRADSTTDLPAPMPGASNGLYPDVRPDGTVEFSSGGVQQKYEMDRYKITKDTAFLFDDLRPWVANSWLHSDWSTPDDAAIPAQNFNEWRVLSGEEARLLMHSQIILGSKGLIFYWGASMDSATTPANYNRPNGFSKDIGISSNLIHPLWSNLALRSVAGANAMSTYLQGLSYNSDEAGGDYLIRRMMPGDTALAYGYRFGLREAINGWIPPVPPSTTPTPANRIATVRTRLGLATDDDVYIGTQSIRLVTKEITDVLWAGRDTLQNLRLRGWYSKGFREWFVGDSAKFAQVFGTNKPVLKARHLYRDGSNFATTAKTFESADSTFVEATVLQDGTTSMNSSFVVGVLNRRCDPFDYTDTAHNNYMSYRRWDSTLRATSASLRRNARYAQAGAREIAIPFNFKSTSPGGTSPYKLLRIREFGVSDDAAVARKRIDTVIGQDKALSVMFMPGEGKMFHVQVISSENNTSFAGFLDHSNQRKLVAFPVMHSATTRSADVSPVNAPMADGRLASWTRYVAGDTMRYHATFHRRDSATGRLRVYYARSKPLGFGNQPSAVPTSILLSPTIAWDPVVDVSNLIAVRTARGSDSTVEQGDCGFPSIVVRPELDGSMGMTWPNATSPMRQRNMVYITYACKECPSGLWNLSVNHIKFPADIPNDSLQRVAIGTTRAYRLDMFTLPSQLPAQVDSALFKWGTPTINASVRGNFIAWSRPNGIRAAFLYPQEGFLPPGRMTDDIKLRVGAGFETASHPSVNTYSRLNLGELDAGLVWQEGPNTEVGRSICYTRLFADVGGNVTHHIARNMATRTTQAQWGQVIGGNDLILEIAGNGQQPPPPFGVTEINRNMRFPMLFRNLSDYDITNTNTRYTEGLVSQKAERVFYETRTDYYVSGGGGIYTWVPGTWEIGRRAIDVNDYGSHDSTLNPMIWGRGPYLIWSDTADLLSPNVAQGEQVTENAGVANPVGSWYADSVNTLNFTVPNGPYTRDIYHLTYGFSYYGAAANHSLSAYTPLTKLGARGQYPQLAARFSMAEHPGWQRNRRLYEAWSSSARPLNYFPANSVRTNQEQFYKTSAEDDERVVEFTGYRDEYGRTWSVGGIRFADGDTAIVMHNGDGDTRFMSAEVTVPAVSELFVNTRIEPGTEGANLTIRRVSDGAVLNVPLGVAEGEGPVQERQWSMVSDATERYTFSLETDQNAPQELTPVSDIGILTRGPQALQRRAPQGLIDLRAMKIAASDEAHLEVYPTPASDHVTVVMTGKMDMSGAVSYSVTDLTGRSVLSGSVDTPGFWHLDVSSLLNGAYQLHVKNGARHIMTRFVVAK